tara:strand:+ start:944 stop:1069 length:126 start_codon:yes stop_codon:yes gene_type:complete
MHGELKQQYKNEQHERAMTAPIVKEEPVEDLDKRLREKGLI